MLSKFAELTFDDLSKMFALLIAYILCFILGLLEK